MFVKNEIYFDGKRCSSAQECKNCDLQISGEDNKIYLHSFLGNGTLRIIIPTSHNKIYFGSKNIVVRSLSIFMHDAPKSKTENIFVRIGDNNRFQGSVTILSPTQEGYFSGGITIGCYNLFAEGFFFHGRQDHLIYDINTKERVNHEKNIVLEDNIWCGSCVHFLPGAKVSKNSVVGMNSMVNKQFEQENILLAGSPASIKKKNIAWNIYLDNSYLTMDNPMDEVL